MEKDGNKSDALRKGAAFRCPACGRDSVIQVRARFDGWTRTGEDYVCGLCRAVLAPAVAGDAQVPDARGSTVAHAKELLGLTGDIGSDKCACDVLSTGTSDAERRFCRDCRHFLVHPFITRCILHDRTVEPMQDCADFVARSKSDAGKEVK